MTADTDRGARAPLGLRRRLAARSLPLGVALVAVMTLSPPTAYYVVRVGELRSRAAADARRVADELRHEVTSRPVLWEYDSLKILEHLRAYRLQPGVARIVVADRQGRLLPLAPDTGTDPSLLWALAPIDAGATTAGEVWVAMSPARARRTALLLALPFGFIGLLLAGLMLGLPLRALGRAETRIEALVRGLEGSRHELEALNQGLEAQVEARVAELERAFDALAERDARLRSVSGRAVALREAERRAIARDLHDAVGQALTAIRIHLQLIEREASGETAALAHRTVELTDAAIDEVRRAVERLGPAVLAEVGLRSALARLCAASAERGGLEVASVVRLGEGALPAAVETSAYRIVQEALHNALRHAGASRVRVRAEGRDGGLTLSVCDDGRGFDPARCAEGHGLRGMRERAELLGGTFRLRSSAAHGTGIRVTLPLVPDEAPPPSTAPRALRS